MVKNADKMDKSFLREVKKMKREFWEIIDLPYINPNVKEYYSNNFERILSNANRIIDDNPNKCAIFWSELFRSDFTITLMLDFQTNMDIKKEVTDIGSSIKLIKKTFENSYQYFSFFTIADKGNVDDLYDYWYLPFKAKDTSKDNPSAWKIGRDNVSGKFWVINNFVPFSFSPSDIKLLRQIRDAESHETLIIKDDKVIILDGKKTKSIEHIKIIEFANFLKSCIAISFDLYIRLLIKERFWIFLVLFIIKNPKYKDTNAPFEILDNPKEKRNTEKLSIDRLFNNRIGAIIWIFASYSLNNLWEDLRTESNRLNVRLSGLGFEIDKPKINNFRDNALCDLYNTISLLNYKIKELDLGIKTEYFEIKPQDLEAANFDNLFNDVLNTLNQIKKSEKKDSSMLLVSLILGTGLVIFGPIARFFEEIDTLLVEKK